MSPCTKSLVILSIFLLLILAKGGASFAQTLTPSEELNALIDRIKEQEDKSRCYEEALRILELATKVTEPSLSDYYYPLSRVANRLRWEGKSGRDKALLILLKLEKLVRENLGQQHHYVGYTMSDIASIYDSDGKIEEAEKIYIDIFRNVASDEGWPKYSIETAASNVASFYRSQGKEKLAAKVLKVPFLREVKKARLKGEVNEKFLQDQRLAYAKTLNRHLLSAAYDKALIKAASNASIVPDDELIWPDLWNKTVADAKDGKLEGATKDAVTKALLAKQGLSKKTLGKAVSFTRPSGLNGWSIKVSHSQLTTPAIKHNRIYLSGGFSETYLYALAALTGEKIWTFKASDSGPTPPAVEGDYVAYTTESCTLYLHNAEEGQLIWSKWLGTHLLSQPALAEDFVYTAYPTKGADFRLAAFNNKDGQRLWETKIASEVLGGPVISGAAIYAATADGSIYHIDRKSGNVLWSSNVQAASAPVLDEGRLLLSYRLPCDDGEGSRQFLGYVDESTGNPTAFENGAPVMKKEASVSFASMADYHAAQTKQVKRLGLKSFRELFHYSGMRPCIMRDKIILTDIDRVRAVDKKSGKHLWDRCFDIKSLDGIFYSYVGDSRLTTVVPAGDCVYTCTADGRVICLNAQDGKTVFDEKLTTEPFQFEPAIHKGKVYAVTTQGTLFCLDTGNPAADGWPMWGGGPGHNGFSR